jgi:hypothetical protein
VDISTNTTVRGAVPDRGDPSKAAPRAVAFVDIELVAVVVVDVVVVVVDVAAGSTVM